MQDSVSEYTTPETLNKLGYAPRQDPSCLVSKVLAADTGGAMDGVVLGKLWAP